MSPAVKYTLGRIGLFLLVVLLLWPVRADLFLKLILAVFVSAMLSYFLMRRWREEMAGQLASRAQRRRAEKERLRAALAGDRPPGGAAGDADGGTGTSGGAARSGGADGGTGTSAGTPGGTGTDSGTGRSGGTGTDSGAGRSGGAGTDSGAGRSGGAGTSGGADGGAGSGDPAPPSP